jgi:hypothetical protein
MIGASMDLDDLLTRAAPPVAPRTPALDDELRALARATRPVRRRRGRLALAGLASVAALGVGVGAATGGVPLPGGWLSSSDGGTCRVDFHVTPRGDSGEATTKTFTATQERATADAADAWLAGFDVATVDVDAAVARWREGEAAARAAEPPGERQPVLRGDELRTTAVGQEVWRELSAYLRGQGLEPDAVLWAVGSDVLDGRCGG